MNIKLDYRVWIKDFQLMTKLKGYSFEGFEVSFPGPERRFFSSDEVILMPATGQLDEQAKMIYVYDILYAPGGELFFISPVRGGFEARGTNGTKREVTDQEFLEGCLIIGNSFEDRDLMLKCKKSTE